MLHQKCLFRAAVWTLVVLSLLTSSPVSAGRIRKDDNPMARDIQILNNADVKVQVFWVNPTSGELVVSVEAGILKGMDTLLNSYIGHTFEVQEVKSKKTNLCRGPEGECRITRFTVTNNEDQKFIIQKDFTVTYEDSRTRALEKAKKVSEECPMPTSEGNDIPDLDAWAECLQQKINQTLDESKQEIEFQASVRKNMGKKLVDYACDDEDFSASVGTYNKTLALGLKSQNPKMQYLFQSDTTKIILIDGFIARSQCKWLQESAKKSDGKGTLEWSAIQDASIKTIVQRIYSAIDQTIEYFPDRFFLDEMAQRDHEFPLFEMDIGEDTTTLKRHLAEEDDRHPLMATFMMFCDAADKGGAVHFPQTGTHVKPKQGQGLLITYMDPNKKNAGIVEEDIFTAEVVECPVKEGKRTTIKYQIPAP